MNPSGSGDHEHFEILLVKAVDEILSDDERTQLDAHVATCSRCAEELQDFQSIKRTTDAMTNRILTTASIESPRPSTAVRRLHGTSFFVLLMSTLLLCGYGAYHLSLDPELPPLVKLVAGMGISALIALLSYAVTVRLRGAGKDPYQEIDR
jgi:hypothetical protein